MVGLPVETVKKVSEGSPNVLDLMREGKIQLMINTPRGGQAHDDGAIIRGTTNLLGLPLITTLSAAMAAVQGIRSLREKPLKVKSLQAHHNMEKV
jgi:carbamoyl-phosphate synthase large subunit